MISKLIKPFRPRDLFDARAVHRRPLLSLIPKFEADSEIHVELAKMKCCHEKVENMFVNEKIFVLSDQYYTKTHE